MWVFFTLSHWLWKPPFEAIVGKKRKARFSTVPLGHVARVATSTGLSVDSVCVSVRAECYVSKWGNCKASYTAMTESIGVFCGLMLILETCGHSVWLLIKRWHSSNLLVYITWHRTLQGSSVLIQIHNICKFQALVMKYGLGMKGFYTNLIEYDLCF